MQRGMVTVKMRSSLAGRELREVGREAKRVCGKDPERVGGARAFKVHEVEYVVEYVCMHALDGQLLRCT